MWWKKKKIPLAPLVPGRDRPAKADTRPLYSYYSVRQSGALPQRGRDAATSLDTPPFSQSPLYTAMLLVCAVIGLLCAVKILMLSAHSKIVVAGNQQLFQLPTASYAETVDASLKSSILNANKLTLDTKGVARDLQTRFPELSSVVVTVPLAGNRPVVYVKPSRASFMLESPSGLYTMADTGYILTKIPKPQQGLTVLVESSRRQPTVGRQFLPASTISFAKIVTFQLRQNGLTITKLELPGNAPYELQAHLAGKAYYLRFNLQADAAQQSGGAVAALRTRMATPPREYIDVRVLGRVYYR